VRKNRPKERAFLNRAGGRERLAINACLHCGITKTNRAAGNPKKQNGIETKSCSGRGSQCGRRESSRRWSKGRNLVVRQGERKTGLTMNLHKTRREQKRRRQGQLLCKGEGDRFERHKVDKGKGPQPGEKIRITWEGDHFTEKNRRLAAIRVMNRASTSRGRKTSLKEEITDGTPENSKSDTIPKGTSALVRSTRTRGSGVGEFRRRNWGGCPKRENLGSNMRKNQ